MTVVKTATQKNNVQKALANAAKDLKLIFSQTLTSYAPVNSIRKCLELPVYVQEPLDSPSLKEEYKEGKYLSYFSFASKDERQKIVFIDDCINKYTYIYFINGDKIYKYTKRGADALSHDSIENGEGEAVLAAAQNFLKGNLSDEMRPISKSESPFVN
jgi:hypothetical protein